MASILSIVFQGAILGLVATLVMDLVMGRLDEGATAPTVAASVLTGVDPRNVTTRRTNVVHYLAGLASGVLFLAMLELGWWLLGIDAGAFGIRGLVVLLVSSLLLYGWLVGFFTLVVLPRYEVGMARQRLRRVRRGWAVLAAVHVGSLAVFWLVLTRLV
jgi:hypothetical protein